MFHTLYRQRLVHLYRARDEGSFMLLEQHSPGHPTTPAALTRSMLMALSIGLCGARCEQDCKTSAGSFMTYRLPLQRVFLLYLFLYFLSDLVPKHAVEVKIKIQGGADKSLARPTSRSCRTEWIVSLERGASSCAELQVFSSYRG